MNKMIVHPDNMDAVMAFVALSKKDLNALETMWCALCNDAKLHVVKPLEN